MLCIIRYKIMKKIFIEFKKIRRRKDLYKIKKNLTYKGIKNNISNL